MSEKQEFQESVINNLQSLLSENFTINNSETQSLAAWTTLSMQILEAEKSLQFSEKFKREDEFSNYEDFVLSHALFKNGILAYAKCFSTSGKGKVSLDAKQLFKDHPELKTIHESIMEIRNTYVAHNDDNNYEMAIVLSKEENDEIILSQTITFRNPIANYSKYYELFDFCSESLVLKINGKADKIEKRIGKKIKFK